MNFKEINDTKEDQSSDNKTSKTFIQRINFIFNVVMKIVIFEIIFFFHLRNYIILGYQILEKSNLYIIEIIIVFKITLMNCIYRLTKTKKFIENEDLNNKKNTLEHLKLSKVHDFFWKFYNADYDKFKFPQNSNSSITPITSTIRFTNIFVNPQSSFEEQTQSVDFTDNNVKREIISVDEPKPDSASSAFSAKIETPSKHKNLFFYHRKSKKDKDDNVVKEIDQKENLDKEKLFFSNLSRSRSKTTINDIDPTFNTAKNDDTISLKKKI